MGTGVLLSHDCVRDRLIAGADTLRSSPQSKPCRGAYPNLARNGRKKRRCKDNADFGRMVVKISSANLAMEKVKILKRGEDFKPSSPPKDLRVKGRRDAAVKDSKTSGRSSVSKINGSDSVPSVKDSRISGRSPVSKIDGNKSVFSSTDKLVPDPDLLPKQIRRTHSQSDKEVYAGSAFFSSPSPSSLPIPGFWKKRSVLSSIANDLATKDLCRLLRLDELC